MALSVKRRHCGDLLVALFLTVMLIAPLGRTELLSSVHKFPIFRVHKYHGVELRPLRPILPVPLVPEQAYGSSSDSNGPPDKPISTIEAVDYKYQLPMDDIPFSKDSYGAPGDSYSPSLDNSPTADAYGIPAEQNTPRGSYEAPRDSYNLPKDNYETSSESYRLANSDYHTSTDNYQQPKYSYVLPAEIQNHDPHQSHVQSYNTPHDTYSYPTKSNSSEKKSNSPLYPRSHSYHQLQDSYHVPVDTYSTAFDTYNPSKTYNALHDSYHPTVESSHFPKSSYYPPENLSNLPRGRYHPPAGTYILPHEGYPMLADTLNRQNSYRIPDKNYNSPVDVSHIPIEDFSPPEKYSPLADSEHHPQETYFHQSETYSATNGNYRSSGKVYTHPHNYYNPPFNVNKRISEFYQPLTPQYGESSREARSRDSSWLTSSGHFITDSELGNFESAASDSPTTSTSSESLFEKPNTSNSSDLGVLDLFGGNGDSEDTGNPFDVLDMAAVLAKYLPTGDGKRPLRTSIRITGPREVQVYPKIRTSPIRVDITSHEGTSKKPPTAQPRKDSGVGEKIVKGVVSNIAGKGKGTSLIKHGSLPPLHLLPPPNIGKKNTFSFDIKGLGANLAATVGKDIVKDVLRGGLHRPIHLLPPPPHPPSSIIPLYMLPHLPPKNLPFDVKNIAKRLAGNVVKNILIGNNHANLLSLPLPPLPVLSHSSIGRTPNFDIKNIGKKVAMKVVKKAIRDAVFGAHEPHILSSPQHPPLHLLPGPAKKPLNLKNIGQKVTKNLLKGAFDLQKLGSVLPKLPRPHLPLPPPHPLPLSLSSLHLFQNHHNIKNMFDTKDVVKGLSKSVVTDLVKHILFGNSGIGKKLPFPVLKKRHGGLHPMHMFLANFFVDNKLHHPRAIQSPFSLLKHPLLAKYLGIRPIHVLVAKNVFENLLKDSTFKKLLVIKPKVATIFFASHLLSSPIFALSNVAKLFELTKINAIHGGTFEKILLKKVAMILALSGKVAAVKSSLLAIPVILADIIGKKLKYLQLAASSIPLALHALLSIHPLAFHLITHPLLNKLPLPAKVAILKHKGLTNLHLALIVAILAHPSLAKILFPLLAVMFKYKALVKLPLLSLLPILTNPVVVKLLLAAVAKTSTVAGATAGVTAGAAAALPISLLKDPVLSKLPTSVLAAFAKNKVLLAKLPLAVIIPLLKTSAGAKLLVPLLAVFAAFPKIGSLPLPLLVPILKDPALTKLLFALAAAFGGKTDGFVGAGATAKAKKPFDLLSRLILAFVGGKVSAITSITGLGGLSTLNGLASLFGNKGSVKFPGFGSEKPLKEISDGISGEVEKGKPVTTPPSTTQQKLAAIGSPYIKFKFPRPEVYIETLVHPRPTTTTQKPYPSAGHPSYGLPLEHRERVTTYESLVEMSTIEPSREYGLPLNSFEPAEDSRPYPTLLETYGPPSSDSHFNAPVNEYTPPKENYGPPKDTYGPPQSEVQPYPAVQNMHGTLGGFYLPQQGNKLHPPSLQTHELPSVNTPVTEGENESPMRIYPPALNNMPQGNYSPHSSESLTELPRENGASERPYPSLREVKPYPAHQDTYGLPASAAPTDTNIPPSNEFPKSEFSKEYRVSSKPYSSSPKEILPIDSYGVPTKSYHLNNYNQPIQISVVDSYSPLDTYSLAKDITPPTVMRPPTQEYPTPYTIQMTHSKPQKPDNQQSFPKLRPYESVKEYGVPNDEFLSTSSGSGSFTPSNEYGTPKENHRHSWERGLPNAEHKPDSNNNLLQEYSSPEELYTNSQGFRPQIHSHSKHVAGAHLIPSLASTTFRGDIPIPNLYEYSIPDSISFSIPESMIKNFFNLYSASDTFSNYGSLKPALNEYGTPNGKIHSFGYHKNHKPGPYEPALEYADYYSHGWVDSNVGNYPPPQGPYSASPSRSTVVGASDSDDNVAAASEEQATVVALTEGISKPLSKNNVDSIDHAMTTLMEGGYSRVQRQPVVSRHLESKLVPTTAKTASSTISGTTSETSTSFTVATTETTVESKLPEADMDSKETKPLPLSERVVLTTSAPVITTSRMLFPWQPISGSRDPAADSTTLVA